MAWGRRGDSRLTMPYERNLVMAIRARDVIEAEVEDDLMTWRKGCSRAGVSKVLMSGGGIHQLRLSMFERL
jgi:hypothetical protein